MRIVVTELPIEDAVERARARLQEVGVQRLLQRYCAQHGGAAPYLAIDWVQAGLRPPPRETSVLWNAMLAARGEGVGSCFTRLLWGKAKEVYEVLGVPEDEEPRGR